MKLLKDKDEATRKKVLNFIKHLQAGHTPRQAASWTGLPLDVLRENSENGDKALKRALDRAHEIQVRAGGQLPTLRRSTSKTTARMRQIALECVFPRLMGHTEKLLEELDPCRKTNPENWKSDRRLYLDLLGKVVTLLPKETISRSTVRKEEGVQGLTLEQVDDRISELKDREDELLGQGELAQARQKLLEHDEEAS